MIITTATSIDGPVPAHTQIQTRGLSPAEASRIGSEAGRLCAVEFAIAFGRGSNADPKPFFPALRTTLAEVVAEMESGGQSSKNCSVWLLAFVDAFEQATGKTI